MTTQIDYLKADLAEIARVFSETPEAFDALADVRDLDLQNYRAVVLDLAMRIVYHGHGVNVLLREELRDPVFAVQRALYECLATISYLTKHAESIREALIFRAYTAEKERRLFANQAELVQERSRLLERMPATSVAEAVRRLDTFPYTWSGKRIRKMFEESDVSGYATLYDYLSAESHANTVGARIRTTQADGIMTIDFGADFSIEDRESNANFARRGIKHALRIAWGVLDAPPVKLRTPDPDLWDWVEPGSSPESSSR